MIKYKICTQSFIICIFSLNSIYVIRENKAVFLWNRLQNRIFFYCIPIYCGADNHQFTSRGVGSDVHTVKEKRWLARECASKRVVRKKKESERASERETECREAFWQSKVVLVVLTSIARQCLYTSAYIPVLLQYSKSNDKMIWANSCEIQCSWVAWSLLYNCDHCG